MLAPIISYSHNTVETPMTPWNDLLKLFYAKPYVKPEAEKRPQTRMQLAQELYDQGYTTRKHLIGALIEAGCTPAGAATFASRVLAGNQQ